MILRWTIYETRSGRPRVGGRNDKAWLIPESPEEVKKLDEYKVRGHLTSCTGKSAIERNLEALKETARAIDPNFTEDPRVIRPD